MNQTEITRVAAYGLLVDDGRILLCRISQELPEWEGHWTLPGGGLEFGEDPVDAAVREIREETGLQAVPGGVAAVDSIHVQREDRAFHAIRIIYHIEEFSGELSDERSGTTDQCRWFPLAGTSALPLVPLARKGLELVRAHTSTG